MFLRALQEIEPEKALGRFSKIWIKFAQYNLDNSGLAEANVVFHKASKITFRSLDELAGVYTSWAELHCSKGNVDAAIAILQ